MAFSLQDKLALMMTSAGSQRQLAAFVGGVSHQQIGRWLTIGQTTPQGEPSRVRPPTDPEILDAIDTAFELHVQVCRDQAQADHIPFSISAPVYATRRIYSDGAIGQMVDIRSTHRLSDELRAQVIRSAHDTRPDFYYAVTVQSLVAQVPYWWYTENRLDFSKIRRTEEMVCYRDHLMPSNEEDDEYSAGRVKLQKINTKVSAMSSIVPASFVIAEVENKLQVRHAPAIGDEGTALATKISFQTNSDRDTYGVKRAGERRKRIDAERKRRQRAAIKAEIKKSTSAKNRAKAKPRR